MSEKLTVGEWMNLPGVQHIPAQVWEDSKLMQLQMRNSNLAYERDDLLDRLTLKDTEIRDLKQELLCTKKALRHARKERDEEKNKHLGVEDKLLTELEEAMYLAEKYRDKYGMFVMRDRKTIPLPWEKENEEDAE